MSNLSLKINNDWSDASGNPVTQTVTPAVQTVVVTDSSGNVITGIKLTHYHITTMSRSLFLPMHIT